MCITGVKPGALTVLNDYRVQFCLIDGERPLATLVAASNGWRRTYQDKRSVPLVRTHSDGPYGKQ